MSDDAPESLRDTASTIARAAGKLLAERFTSTRTVEYKGGIDLVTDADKASEALILSALRERHPDHAILSEEAGFSPGEGLRWIVDPLDGTTNYAHQIPHFCVSIGVEDSEGVLAGAIYDPMLDELYSAARGQGATLNGNPIHPSAAASFQHALLCTGFPYNIHQHPDGPLGLLKRFLQKAQGIRRMGSAALDLAYVAAGRLDGFFEFGLKPWDTAAGGLLVLEAGGSMRLINGRSWDVAIGDVVAAAPGMTALLEAECAAFMRELPPRTTSPDGQLPVPGSR